MKINKKLSMEISGLSDTQKIVQVYQQIAAMRMRKVKLSVLTNRSFLDGINNIYGQVSSNYKKGLFADNKKNKHMVRPTNGKTVFVLLSANTGLYGDIVRRVYDLFFQDLKRTDADVVIVGKVGKRLLDSSNYEKQYKYFDFSDSGSDEENSKELLKEILPYESINVYHGYFADVLVQVPVKTPVAGNIMKDSESPVNKTNNDKTTFSCIIEPSIEEVLAFFESEMLESIFIQTVYESSLSKFASRMISLDRATMRIKKRFEQTRYQVRKIKHKTTNSNQLNLISSISLWSTH